LADENVPIEAVKALKRKGVDIVSVIEFSSGLSDIGVLDLANRKIGYSSPLTRISAS
jgi:acyl CoA:acetate/3-ketoacid CoA transferase alpha subunit